MVNNHAVVAVANPTYEITLEDKERVLTSARNLALPLDKAIIQIIERQYIVDSYDGVKIRWVWSAVAWRLRYP